MVCVLDAITELLDQPLPEPHPYCFRQVICVLCDLQLKPSQQIQELLHKNNFFVSNFPFPPLHYLR